MIKILVAGGNGQVGQNLAKYGPKFHVQIIALPHSELDITEPDSIHKAFSEIQPDLVINAAAYTAVDQAESEPENAFKINQEGPYNLSKACLFFDIPLLHISTDYVFDGESNQPYNENDLVNPQGVYAKSKEAGEQSVRNTLKKHIILRTSWVFSVEGNNFVKTMLRLAENNDSLSIVHDQIGGPTSADSIAKTLLEVATRCQNFKEEEWGTYHFCGTPYVTWHDFALEIFKEANNSTGLQIPKLRPISSAEFPTAAVRPKNSRLCNTKLEKLLGTPSISWFIDMKNVIASFRRKT